MKITARVENEMGSHRVEMTSGDTAHSVIIPPKSGGGSSINGGELLFLALATCYCNDVYREANQRGIPVEKVEVMVEGEFGAAGEPARNVSYRAKVSARAPEADILAVMQAADRLAEIQNTLRLATPVHLDGMETVEIV